MEETKFEGALVEHEGRMYQEVQVKKNHCDGCVFDTSEYSCNGPDCHSYSIYKEVENQDE